MAEEGGGEGNGEAKGGVEKEGGEINILEKKLFRLQICIANFGAWAGQC